ncbi:MAG: TonB-dependent receptor [Proteobacteria bacterium]|nr:TonB-dependent receptor [Pseudomonadota bacterium]
MQSPKLNLLVWTSVCCAMAASSLAIGAEESSTLEEVVVTAQKRAQNVQDVPIAISTFSADSILERGVVDVAALSNVAPNITLDAGTPFSGSSAVLSAFIRGIGANDFAMNLDPGVGIYIDGVYLARTVGANLDLPDVERIEVLKGPQGTLFGRNTIGGAISVVTRDPGKEFAFRGDVTAGRYNRMDVRASADLPLSDTLGATITVSSKNRDGYQKRIPFPDAARFVVDPATAFRTTGNQTSDAEGGQGEWTARAKLKWDASDRVVVRLGGDFLKIDQSSMANSLLATTEFVPGPFAGLAANNIPGTALDVVTGSSGFLFAGLYNFCIGANSTQIAARNAANLCGPRGTSLNSSQLIGGLAGVNIDANPDNNRLPYDSRYILADKDKSYATGNSFSDMQVWGLNETTDIDLGGSMALKSITSYRDLEWASGMDIDGSPVQMLEPSFSLAQWQFSQELQLTGEAAGGRANYVLGGYYFQEKGYMEDYVTFSDGLLQIFGPNHLKTKNYAAFGQFDMKLTDRLGVTAGARYTKENKSFNGGQTDLNGFNYKLFNCVVYGNPCTTAIGFNDPTQPLRYYVSETQHKKFSNFSPKIGFQFHATEDVMAYTSWSKGYKTGGWTTRLSNPLPTAPDFDEEKAESFEAGVKSQLLDHRLQVNAAAFTTKYDGIQLNFQEGVSPTIRNAGRARIDGGEVELSAIVGDGLTLDASVGYLDARYTSVDAQAVVAANPFQQGITRGSSLPKTPKWKFNLSPRYEVKAPSGGKIVFLADYTRSSSLRNDTEGTYLLNRPSVSLVNASVAYHAQDGRWNLTGGAMNVTNERYLVTGQAQIAGGQIYGTWNRPREWYVRLGYEL